MFASISPIHSMPVIAAGCYLQDE
ncbi:variable surface lipoprotein [Parasphingorhabdus sp.]